MAGLAEVHRRHWRKGVTEPGADRALTAQAVHRLIALGLAHETPEGVTPQPALARFGYGEPQLSGTSEAS